MSLRVWLPLNGNINNQGLADVTVTLNGPVVDNNGKIGKCYNFDGTNDRISCSTLPLEYPISIAAWFNCKDIPLESAHYIVAFNRFVDGFGGGENMGVGLCIDTGRLGFYIKGVFYYVDLNITPINDTWYHVAITIESSGMIKVYLNGVLTRTITVSSLTESNWLTIGARASSITGGAGNSVYYFKGLINDVRLYDHCLSTKEVKELAKGMVLHNKFSGIGVENLLRDSYSCASWSNTGFIQNTSDSDGSAIFSATRSGLSADNIYSITPNIISRSDALELGGITISFDFMHERILYNSSNQELDNKNILVVAAITSNNTQISWNIPDLDLGNFDGEWRRISVSLTSNDLLKSETGNYTPDDIVGFSISIRIVRNGTFHVKHIKVEKGLKGTPWVPNKADPEYETLGFNYYCNFLDNSGNHSYTGITYPDTVDLISDSPRFGTAVRFKGYTADSIGVENKSTIYIEGWKYTYTISIWMKFSELKNINMLIFGDVTLKTDGTHFFINDYQYTELAPFNDNDWHMYVITSSDATPYAPLLFIDGVKYKSNAVSTVMGDLRIPLSLDNDHAALLIPNQSTAADSMNITCVSDLRIYSTILDSAEVESMYKTSASINRYGTMFACEFKEER